MEKNISPLDRARAIAAAMPERGMFAGTDWRIAPRAFPISAELVMQLESLGPQLLAFYRAANLLYRFSVRGSQPKWIADYLDAGKPPMLVEASRQNRFKGDVPRVIRPDILLESVAAGGDRGSFKITELDSVPGGIGLTAWFNQIYSSLGDVVVGGPRAMKDGFEQTLRECTDAAAPMVRIAVSDEAKTYRPEMEWLARELAAEAFDIRAVAPEQISLEDGKRPDIVYRFFELFDMQNVPNALALLEASGAGKVEVTPPFKPQLEEKMLFALFWHVELNNFWRQELGAKTVTALQQVIPYTWIMDPAPLPPHAVIPELGIRDWRELAGFSQKQRELVIKISGFSPDAWGSRGVTIGHDLPASEWTEAIEHAIKSFPTHPHILQRYHRTGVVKAHWADMENGKLHTMSGRVRLCPYYFVIGDDARLGGVLATICPLDKKIIHGMSEAIMAPCRVAESGDSAS